MERSKERIIEEKNEVTEPTPKKGFFRDIGRSILRVLRGEKEETCEDSYEDNEVKFESGKESTFSIRLEKESDLVTNAQIHCGIRISLDPEEGESLSDFRNNLVGKTIYIYSAVEKELLPGLNKEIKKKEIPKWTIAKIYPKVKYTIDVVFEGEQEYMVFGVHLFLRIESDPPLEPEAALFASTSAITKELINSVPVFSNKIEEMCSSIFEKGLDIKNLLINGVGAFESHTEEEHKTDTPYIYSFHK